MIANIVFRWPQARGPMQFEAIQRRGQTHARPLWSLALAFCMPFL